MDENRGESGDWGYAYAGMGSTYKLAQIKDSGPNDVWRPNRVLSVPVPKIDLFIYLSKIEK